jgi:hypothetical protein
VGHDPDFGIPDQRAVAYRQAGNRSLSVGDVVQVDAIWLAVDPIRFRQLTQVPTGIALGTEPVHGSTPILLPPEQQSAFG